MINKVNKVVIIGLCCMLYLAACVKRRPVVSEDDVCKTIGCKIDSFYLIANNIPVITIQNGCNKMNRGNFQQIDVNEKLSSVLDNTMSIGVLPSSTNASGVIMVELANINNSFRVRTFTQEKCDTTTTSFIASGMVLNTSMIMPMLPPGRYNFTFESLAGPAIKKTLTVE